MPQTRTNALVWGGVWAFDKEFKRSEVLAALEPLGAVEASEARPTWKIYFAQELPRDSEILNLLDTAGRMIYRGHQERVVPIEDEYVEKFDLTEWEAVND